MPFVKPGQDSRCRRPHHGLNSILLQRYSPPEKPRRDKPIRIGLLLACPLRVRIVARYGTHAGGGNRVPIGCRMAAHVSESLGPNCLHYSWRESIPTYATEAMTASHLAGLPTLAASVRWKRIAPSSR